MKKLLLLVVAAFVGASFLQAQIVADFEDGTNGPLTLHVMGCGAWDDDTQHPVNETFMVVDNPDASGINTSSKVLKFVRRGTVNGGMPWGGFWANAVPNVDVTTNKYVHVKVWKPRISPVRFKLEGGPSGTLETGSISPQTSTGMWEDIVFDFTTMDGAYPVIALMPDFEDPMTMEDDIDIYIDEIMLSSDPNPITDFAVISDFEDGTNYPLTLHVMGCGAWDDDTQHPVNETFMVVDNPDASGINTSSKVMKFVRRGSDNGGMPWGGFWANADPNVDVTDYKYVHVKVWKPRVSPLRFKLEGGPSGTLETGSMNSQTTTGMWEDIVFDFTSMDGAYPVIAFMPDFEDPLALTEDIEIYFDDIIISGDPNPLTVGVSKVQAMDFNMYPNPCTTQFSIDLKEDISYLSIFNITGQKVISIQNIEKGSINVDISSLTPGMYIVSLLGQNNQMISKKLIKH